MPEKKAEAEALLYIVGEDGISTDSLISVLEIGKDEILKILEELREEYLSETHGIELTEYGGLWRFMTKKEVNETALKLLQLNQSTTLSQSALETLAIIAYKQPITRVEIEEIRGVGCEMMLRRLLTRNLIKEAGRADAPGRPILYEVTPEFMDTFSLVSLKELPELPTYQSEEEETLF